MLSPDQGVLPELDPLSFRRFIGGLPTSMPREEAAAWLRLMIDNRTLRSAGTAGFLIYELTMEDESAKGLVAEVGLDGYESGRIKRHEETRSETETGLANRLAAVRGSGSPVALAHRSSPAIQTAITELSAGPPDLRFIASDGVMHSLWIVTDPEPTHELTVAFGDLESLYITDGHHRMAAAARMARDERARNPEHTGAEPYNYAVAALFSADQLRLRAFTRCVIGEFGFSKSSLLSRIERSFTVEPAPVEEPGPRRRGEFGMVVEGQAYRLAIRNSDLPKDPYRSLDVVFLQEHVLGPAFGITDPRSDARLHFVSDRVQPDDVLHEHCWAWFKPFPATVSDVMAVADHGFTMPPKSTWFEPKLPTGLVVRLLD
jgi:uncharacterized protein (DUF1015 family)